MTRRSFAAALSDQRDREILPPRQFRRNWLIDSARIVFVSFAVTIGAAAVMVIAFALFWPAGKGLWDIGTRLTVGGT